VVPQAGHERSTAESAHVNRRIPVRYCDLAVLIGLPDSPGIYPQRGVDGATFRAVSVAEARYLAASG
jgi:hypothetical protein